MVMSPDSGDRSAHFCNFVVLNPVFLINDKYWLLEGLSMSKWQCTVCGYIYDPDEGDPQSGVAPETAFEDLPSDWVCPMCGAAKEDFEKI